MKQFETYIFSFSFSSGREEEVKGCGMHCMVHAVSYDRGI